jgi:hypothetical protein
MTWFQQDAVRPVGHAVSHALLRKRGIDVQAIGAVVVSGRFPANAAAQSIR